VPFEFLGPVLSAIGQTPKVDLDRLEANEVRDLEGASYQLITAALEHRPPGLERRGLSLADVASLAPPNYSLDQIQRLFGYLRAVLQADLRPENLSLAPDVEDLARRALVLPEEQRTLFQLVRTLRVGIYKARLIKVVEEVGSAVRAPLPSLDLGAYSPEFRATPGDSAAAESDRFFATGGTASAKSSGAESHGPAGGGHGGHPTAAAAAANEPRCVGCGGIASSVHVCGAPLCHTCVGQYPHCSKCGQPVPANSLRPIRISVRESHGPHALAPAPGAAEDAHAAARKAKSTGPEPGRPTPHESTGRGDHRGEATTEHASRAGKSSTDRGRESEEEDEDEEEEPSKRSAGGASEPSSPEAPARPRREKVDNEPRL
jgi:hypothetical protein